MRKGPPPQILRVRIRDQGPGIADIQAILDGRYTSQTGMGLGLVGARRLMDEFHVESPPGHGAVVSLGKNLPKRGAAEPAPDLARVAQELARSAPQNPFEEMQRQNQELLRALEELQTRQAQLARLNRELDDTNRGVVALYAELDEKAQYLQRASELKSRFLSDMSHEFRTPLGSILGLTRLLLDRADGPLAPEQEKQVTFIRTSAESLSDLVNDLLDLAKIEAGKTVVRPGAFEVADLFGALRGMFRPLFSQDRVALVFEPVGEIPALYTDEGKVSQILRNFISNALKFTRRGEVRVSAALAAGDQVAFSVADTGVGIAPEDQERIFEEFGQIEGAIQKQVTGTGLGLPLSRKLAELLGGGVSVTSAPGAGSTFSAIIPLVYAGPAGAAVGGGGAGRAQKDGAGAPGEKEPQHV